VLLRKVRWHHWGGRKATGRGRAYYDPNDTGRFSSKWDPVRVVASHKVHYGKCCGGIVLNMTFYVRLKVISLAKTPGGLARIEVFHPYPTE
jgi:hypothetical protein